MTLTSNATYYGATALYSCNTNYVLVGVSRRLCLENGTWSSEEPICRGNTATCVGKKLEIKECVGVSEIQCQAPDTIEGVTFKVSTHSIGGVAYYSCPRGFIMNGNSTRVCVHKGVWSGRAPGCSGKNNLSSKNFSTK